MTKYLNTETGDTLYLMDDTIMLWLGRMIYGEGGRSPSGAHRAAMLWSMVNRYLLHPGRKYWPNFIYMIRRFSQPINPHWQRGGKYVLGNPRHPASSEKLLRRREQICALEYKSLPGLIKSSLQIFREGNLPPPLHVIGKRRISNWASYDGVRTKFPDGVDIEGNWFIEDKALDKGHVVIDHW